MGTSLYVVLQNWSAITEIIFRGEAEDNKAICNRILTSGIRVLYHATSNNLYHFKIFWILEGLDTFSIVIIAFRLILTRYIFANRSNYEVSN